MAIEVQPLRLETIEVNVIGTTPLIMHCFSRKTAIEMELQHTGKKIKKREVKDPMADCLGCFHPPSDDGTSPFSFPSMGFKHGIVATARLNSMKMVDLRQAVHVMDVFVPIYGVWEMQMDVVRNSNGAPDIRHRPYFFQWASTLKIRFDAGFLSEQQVVNMLNAAGFQSGIGDWRPQRDGSHGTYQVATRKAIQPIIDITPAKLEAA